MLCKVGAVCLLCVKWLWAMLGHLSDPWGVTVCLPLLVRLLLLAGVSQQAEWMAQVCQRTSQAHFHNAAEEFLRHVLHHVYFHLDFARSLLGADGLSLPQVWQVMRICWALPASCWSLVWC